MTIKGKTVQGQSVEVLVDDTGRVLLAPESVGGAGYRRDADTPYAADGQAHPLLFNNVGRLKVAAMPGDYIPVTGNITATQPTINTPVVGGTVQADVGKASNVVMYCTGTFAGVNCSFEASIDNGTTWFSIQAVRTNANTIEITTGSLSAAPVYAWELSVNAYTHVRVRCTARTSGTQSWRIQPGAYATEPIPAAQATATQPISGTVTVTFPTPTALNFNSSATTNLTVVKSTAGTLYGIKMRNKSAAILYLKLYNKATAPVLATDVPVLVLPIAAGGLLALDFGAVGHRFLLGIGMATTVNEADTDTTAVAAGDLRGLISFI